MLKFKEVAEWLIAINCKFIDNNIFIGSNPIFFKFLVTKVYSLIW